MTTTAYAAAFLAAAFAMPSATLASVTPGPIAQVAAPATESPTNVVDDLTMRLVRSKIKYVFVLYQENRSFDSYFGTFPGAAGIYSQAAAKTPGFTQPLLDIDGKTTTISPFRIGPSLYAGTTADVDHSHPRIVAKMDIKNGVAQMDNFALVEERKHMEGATPSLAAKQWGELAMAHEDCSTIPFLWNYANRFTLYDHIFSSFTGPSTPGNLAIIGAQAGQTQWLLHPREAYADNGASGAGVPAMNDADPFPGSAGDPFAAAAHLGYNPKDFASGKIQDNLTFATLPLTLAGAELEKIVIADRHPDTDLADVRDDIAEIGRGGGGAHDWAWYEEGYGRESTDADGPVTADGSHASYITHHNGPQYFAYIGNNPQMASRLKTLGGFFNDIDRAALPADGGIYYVKGGYRNIFGLKPATGGPQTALGDDDHPGYSDAQISEALVAQEINHIAKSKYWSQSAIVLTWDDSEGDYDHVAPPLRETGPDGSPISNGPRVPLLVISPLAKDHQISHASGDHGSVVKMIDHIFGLTPLALLPNERKAREIGKQRFGNADLGPDDALTPNVTDLLDALDPARLAGTKAPIPSTYAIVPDSEMSPDVQNDGNGCRRDGIVPTDIALRVPNPVPADFNPRP